VGPRYLITGGCGFIGVNVIRRLAGAAGHIRVLDNLSLGRAADVEGLGVELQVGDIRDRDAVARAMAGIDVVVHLAAHTRVIDSIENPWENFEINARGTLVCLSEARAAGVSRFVMASTGGAIVGDRQPPVHEDMGARPLAPYGASKLAGEGYCSAYWGSYGLQTVALRFTNVYGPYSYAKASAVAKFMKQVLRGETLTVFGDGTQTRDFLFVGDLCRAVAAACERDVPFGRPYQIASGVETPLLDLIEALRGLAGPDRVRVEFAPARPGEVVRNFGSFADARQHLAYEPATSLHDGLAQTWAWFQGVPPELLQTAG
jgi:UDP-glucose 4-epimerase